MNKIPQSIHISKKLWIDYLTAQGWAIHIGNDVLLDKRPKWSGHDTELIARKNGVGGYTIWATKTKENAQAMDNQAITIGGQYD